MVREKQQIVVLEAFSGRHSGGNRSVKSALAAKGLVFHTELSPSGAKAPEPR
jgi:hypothetical protein